MEKINSLLDGKDTVKEMTDGEFRGIVVT